jgi:EmrB/QacA subfamily drug resistance transporter
MAGIEGDDGAALTTRDVRWVFVALLLAILMATLDQSIVSPALPTIVGDLHGLRQMSWVISGYVLTTTISLPFYGKLGDLIGRKRVFLSAIAIFLAGSVLAGASQDIVALIAFRALQGIGAGGLITVAQAIIADIVPPRERGRYMGPLVAVSLVSTVAGPLLGGVFTDHLSWRWCFYVNVPVGAAALLVTWAVLRESPRASRVQLDVTGALLLASASACLVFLTSWAGSLYGWGSWQIISLIVAVAVLVVLFVIAERSAAEPVMPLGLFRDRVFSIAGLVGLLTGFCVLGPVAFIPTFLQMVYGVSATASGLLTLPLIGAMMVSAIAAGRIVTATGHHRMLPVVGTAVATVGLGLLSLMNERTSLLQDGVSMAVFGLGMGLVQTVLTLAVQNSVPLRDLGAATSANTYFRAIGSAIGAAVVGTLFASRLPGTTAITPALVHGLPPSARDGFVHAYAAALPPTFLLLVPVLGAAFVLSWFLPERPMRSGRPVLAPSPDAEPLEAAAPEPPSRPGPGPGS